MSEPRTQNEIVGDNEPLFLEGLGRICPYCKTWSRFKRPDGKKNQCFTASCPCCHKDFEIIPGVRPVR